MAGTRKRLRTVLSAVLILLVSGGYITYVCMQPIAALSPRTTFAYSRPTRPVNLTWPSFGEAALGGVNYGILATHGAEQPLPTASTIKVLTALAVLREQPLQPNEDGPLITLTQADVDAYNKYVSMDGSVARVAVGEQLTERQALEALLLPSANNIAETLARWAFGSIDAYDTYATTYAHELGMAQTTVTDPSGFMPTTVSTPHDLVTLGIAAMGDQTLATIVRETSATIPVQGVIRNVNVLLGQDGIVGIKTGNNDQDPGCFLFAATKTISGTPITIVGAIMNGPTLGAAMWSALPLLESAANNFSSITVVDSGSSLATYTAPWGDHSAAIADKAVSFIAWNGTTIKTSLSLSTLRVPANDEATVGSLTVTGDKPQTIPVILEHKISKPNIFWRLLHPKTSSAK